MARKNKNARERITPRKLKIEKPRAKVVLYPRRDKNDIYIGRLVAVGEWVR